MSGHANMRSTFQQCALRHCSLAITRLVGVLYNWGFFTVLEVSAGIGNES